MQEQPELPVHKQCTAHSGVDSRLTATHWLLSILIAVNLASAGWQFIALADMKDRLANSATQSALSAAEDRAMGARLVSLEQRLQLLESQIKHTSAKEF